LAIKIVNKRAASSTQLAKCCTISKVHLVSRLLSYNCSSQLHEHKQKLHIAYWMS